MPYLTPRTSRVHIDNLEHNTQEEDSSEVPAFTWRSTSQSRRYATQNNLRVQESTPSTLLLDLDTEDDLYRAMAFAGYLKECSIASAYTTTLSKSRRWHMTITLTRELDVPTRIALQAVCGSDRRKEFCSLMNFIVNGESNPIILFRPTPAVENGR
jgi:hypothetical protein